MEKDIASISRISLLVLALLNQLLTALGYSPVPISDEEAKHAVSAIFTIVTAIVAAYKDNRVKVSKRKK